MLVVGCVLYFFPLVVLGEEITGLPGWNTKLPSRMFSGYLDAGNPEYKMFYWFVESESDPTVDPVVLWLNGGPGASSISYGLLEENGPFRMDTSGSLNSSHPNLKLRPFRWTKKASVLFWESPPGVGYSYCQTGACPTWNDNTTATANYGFLVSFFSEFPQYNHNPFYIIGESYGGVYVPTLAHNIMMGSASINLKGIAMGNSCTGNGWGTTCSLDMMKYGLRVLRDRTMLPDVLYQSVMRECQDPNFPDRLAWGNNATVKCQQAVITASNTVGKFNLLNIYDTCPNGLIHFVDRICTGRSQGHRTVHWACDHASKSTEKHQNRWEIPNIINQEIPNTTEKHQNQEIPNAGATGTFVCVGNLSLNWLRQDDVQQALHAQRPWGGQHFDYNRNLQDILPLIHKLTEKYKIWFYTGDEDTNVPYAATEVFLQQTGYPIKDAWKPWLLMNVTGTPVGGYVTEYDAPNDFRWLTVKHSGHIVPHYTPAAAYELLMQFISK